MKLPLPIKKIARAGRSVLERLRYRGNAVECNVCGATARSWIYGRIDGRCPTCRCPTRTRVLRWYLANQVGDPAALRVLHFAPERALQPRLATWGAKRYDTCDLRTGYTYQVDIQRTPFDDGSYDLVLCSHVLEHIPDDKAAMRELRRICSPTGRVLIMVPLNAALPTREDLSSTLTPEERRRQFGEIDHLREYGLDLEQMLRDAGFRVTPFEVATAVPQADRERHGLAAELIFVCTL